MRIKIGGRHYRLVFLPRIYHEDQEVDGLCDAPDLKGKSIYVRSGLRGKERIEVLVHEMLHAAFWHLCEESVEDTAKEIAEVLWRLGYRLPAE
jgi:hypothetical protein